MGAWNRSSKTIAAVGVVMLIVGCAAPAPGPLTNRPAAATSPSPIARPSPSPTALHPSGPAFVLLRSSEITTGARMNFQSQGFQPGEQATVTIEDAQGAVQATLDPVVVSKDGNVDEVSVIAPDGLAPGEHLLRITGQSSGRSARTRFNLHQITPSILLDTYSAKSDHTFGFSGSGFAPDELVDVRLGGLGGDPLASFPTDAGGNVAAENVPCRSSSQAITPCISLASGRRFPSQLPSMCRDSLHG